MYIVDDPIRNEQNMPDPHVFSIHPQRVIVSGKRGLLEETTYFLSRSFPPRLSDFPSNNRMVYSHGPSNEPPVISSWYTGSHA